MDRFEEVYQQMMGFVESGTINDEFENGECGELYGKTYDARVRLSRKLDGNDNGENADTLCIVDAYEKMIKILCRKSYEYGCLDGRNTLGKIL